MDNKIIFVRTSKGDDEMHNRTSHLPGDVKRALLMVDGTATFGEIKKRAAPSMRASLGDMFRELEKGGFIQDKDVVGKSPKMAVPPKMSAPTKMSAPGKMSVPGKMSTPQKQQTVEDDGGELDFLTGFPVTPPETPALVSDNDRNLRAEAEENSRKEIEAAKIKAQREAEAILRKAEQEAAKIREETARRASGEAEAVRLKAEQEATRARNELESDKLKNDQDSKLRLEAAIKEQQQAAEALRSKTAQETQKARDEFEAARLKAEQETKRSLEAAAKAREQAEAARAKAEQEAQRVRDELEAARLKVEQEAKRVRDELEAARVKAEQEAKLRLEAAARERAQAEAARVKAEQEAAKLQAELEAARLKAEQEADARREAAAKAQARIKAEEDAAQARIVAELLAKQEQQAAPAAKPGAFAFDAFQIEEPQLSAEPPKAQPPAQKTEPAEAAPAARKQDTFAFDSFHVDEAQSPAEPHKEPQPAQTDVGQSAKRSTAESEQVESKPDKETIKREAQERIAAEQRIAAEKQAQALADAQANQLAEVQAKVWADAEQRALEVAKANAGRAIYQAESPLPETSPAKKPAAAARVPRKPFAWGKLVGFFFKLGIFLLVLLACALFIVPYVLPMRDYMPRVQQLLSEKLHQPVHIGYLSGRILPMPRLELGEIYIGDAKQFQAKDAQINFSLAGLFIDEKPISSIEFKEVKVRSAWVRNAADWLQQIARDRQYPVSSMLISQGTLDADAFQLTGIEGELVFSPAGKFTQANLRAEGGKLTLGLNATAENKLQAAITVRGSTLPLLPHWVFDELTAKGELSNDELQISNYDARIMGGVVQGIASINWRSGWRAQGTLNAKSIPMQNMSKLLDGNVDGAARFKMTSADLAGLTDSAVLDGSFTAVNGMISGMDIVETARMRSRENLHGGRTHFDALNGVISYADNTYHFKQVRVDAGVLNATATFDVTRQQLSGKMNVNLSMHDGAGAVDLKMGGAIDNPTLLYAP